MKHYIYALLDPRSTEIRYIGQTTRDPERRLTSHLWEAKNSRQSSYLFNWLNSLKVRPLLVIIERVSPSRWEARERYWIKLWKNEGHRLVNTTVGGGGFNPETRNRLSNAALGHPVKEETRRKISKAHKGKSFSRAHRAKLSRSHIGKTRGPRSEETKLKIGKANKGRKLGPMSPQRLAIHRKAMKRVWDERSSEERTAIGQRIWNTRLQKRSMQDDNK